MAKLLFIMQVVDWEDAITCPYCRPRNLKLALTYTPFRNINNGNFVLVRSHDPLLVPMLMGKTQNDVIKDDQNENFKMVRVQWWVLVKEMSNSDK
jgi:hypothetical protein